jgi:hypothetical protein
MDRCSPGVNLMRPKRAEQICVPWQRGAEGIAANPRKGSFAGFSMILANHPNGLGAMIYIVKISRGPVRFLVNFLGDIQKDADAGKRKEERGSTR